MEEREQGILPLKLQCDTQTHRHEDDKDVGEGGVAGCVPVLHSHSLQGSC